MPVSNSERQRAWRDRQRQSVAWQPLICAACGSPHRGAHGVICASCWTRVTPDGKAANAERVRRAREKSRRKSDGM
jgi:hypothetical protein